MGPFFFAVGELSFLRKLEFVSIGYTILILLARLIVQIKQFQQMGG